MESLEEVFAIDPDTLQRTLRPPCAASCGCRRACGAPTRSPWAEESIDAVIVTTCTGYLCPGLSGYVVEQLGLRHDVLGFDLVGQGCAGALPNWQLANALLQAAQRDHVLRFASKFAARPCIWMMIPAY